MFGVGLDGSGSPQLNEANNDNTPVFYVTLSDSTLWREDLITGAPLSNGGGIPEPGATMGHIYRALNLCLMAKRKPIAGSLQIAFPSSNQAPC
jgi:hypothetical protein